MLKRAFGTSKPKEVKRIGVFINLTRPIDIYDMRKSLFGRFISVEKKIPFQAFLFTDKKDKDLETKNRDILEKLEFHFDKEVQISQEKLKTEIDHSLGILREVGFHHPARQNQGKRDRIHDLQHERT